MMFLLFFLNLAHAACSPLPTGHESLCQLEWKDDGVQVALKKNGCEFPEGKKSDCLKLFSCGPIQEEGDLILLKGTDLNIYCQEQKRDFFSSKAKNGPEVYFVCHKKKFSHLDLRSKDKKHQKKCQIKF